MLNNSNEITAVTVAAVFCKEKGGGVRNCPSLLGILVCTIGGVRVGIALFAGFRSFEMVIWC